MIYKPLNLNSLFWNVASTDGESRRRQRSADEISAQNDAAAKQRLFVIKKHHATHLHYDFRLGHDGVLKSWAVPYGPSYWPGNQRAAIQVEDHRREYAFFEGVISAGYGAGTVMLWDWGIWEPHRSCTDVDASLRNGLLKFTLNGERLKGRWVLTRGKCSPGSHRNPVWMLAKEQDSFARSETAMSVLEEAPNSASSRKTLEEIAQSWYRVKSKNELQGKLFDE